MPVRNADVAAAFEEIADLLEIEGANPFRVRAYRNAARNVQGLGREVRTLIEEGFDLTRLPGIGKDLASKIQEIVQTGSCQELAALRKRTPPALSVLLRVPGLGPKRVGALHQALGVDTRGELERALHAGRVRDVPGFGEKTERRILDALAAHAGKKQRFPLAIAAEHGEPLVEYLRSTPGVKDVFIAGSYRRGKDTVGDLDLLATAAHGSAVMQRFVEYDQVKEVVSQGETRASVVLVCGIQVDLRVVERTSLGAALQYFTGSKAHNIAIRRLGQRKGLKINEYGVFKGERRVAGQTEASVYKAVGLPYITPELREDRGEIEAARQDALPKLVELSDLKGDLHLHTRASGGEGTVEALARAARERGLRYFAVTDDWRRLDERRLRQQLEEIDRLNERLEGLRILKGVEAGILDDGRLDFPQSLRGELDLMVGAIYERFDLPRARQTRRLLRALDEPCLSILAQPSARLPGAEAYDIDIAQVVRAAANRRCILALSPRPGRSELGDSYARLARDEGVLISIGSDARRPAEFAELRFAVALARRGWLAAKDVVNTRPLAELRKQLAQAR